MTEIIEGEGGEEVEIEAEAEVGTEGNSREE